MPMNAELKNELVLSLLCTLADYCKITGQGVTEVVLEFIMAALKKGGEPELATLCRAFNDEAGTYFDLLSKDCPENVQLLFPPSEVRN